MSQSHNSLCVCVCVCVCVSKFIFKCAWAHYYSPCAAPAICLITFQSPLYCMSGWHTTHTNTHTSSKCVSLPLFLGGPPSSPPSSFSFYISRQLTFFSLFPSSLLFCPSLLSCFPSVSPLSPPFSLEKKKKTSSLRLARNPDVYV